MDSTTQSAAFEQLVREHQATIYSVCYMFAQDKAEADDLFQEVLIHLWQGFERFRGESSPRTWVYRVSLNTCLSHKRKKHVKTVPLELSADFCDERSPEGRQNRMLHERISRLEKFDRAIVLLWLEDMTYEEIAAITGLSPKAVGVRLFRIKEKLKTL